MISGKREELRAKLEDVYFTEENGVTRLYQRQLDDLARQVADVNSPPKVDSYETGKAIRKKMDKTKAREADYRLWVQSNFGKVLGAKFFKNEAGRRRPYTMDEIVKEMTRTVRGGENWFYGAGSIRSHVAQQFKSIKTIKDKRRSIVTDEEFSKIKDETNNELFALADKFAPHHPDGKRFGWTDTFGQIMMDLSKGRTREWRDSWTTQPPAELWREAAAYLDKLRDLPTQYFEIKAQRSVGLNEFTAALVPKDTSPELVRALEQNGLEIVRYDKAKDGGRQAALQKVLPRVAFSRRAVASLAGDELNAVSGQTLAQKAREWYRTKLVGRTVTNRETGWTITFTGRGAKKTVNAKGDDLLRLVPALRQIIESGELISSQPDRRQRPDVLAIHTFRATVNLGDRPRDVVAIVRETRDGRFHYDLAKDFDAGARFSKEPSVQMSPQAQVRSPAFEDSADTLNIELFEDAFNQAAPALPAIAADLQRRLDTYGIKGLTLALQDVIEAQQDDGTWFTADGYYLNGMIAVALDADAEGRGTGFTLDHEINHPRPARRAAVGPWGRGAVGPPPRPVHGDRVEHPVPRRSGRHRGSRSAIPT